MSKKSKIVNFKQACELVRQAQASRQKVAFTSGCFDIFHIGHLLFLEKSKQGANVLVIGVDDNATVERAKGRPSVL